MIYNKLECILQETVIRIEKLHVQYEDEYLIQIQHLSPKEKDVLKQFYKQHTWGLGSAKILALYKNAGIITATEYVLSLSSRETVQQVMNDLLETEHILLAELTIISSLDFGCSAATREILKDCFHFALDDLLENINVIPCNYLHRLRNYLPDIELNALRIQHIQLLLGRESFVSAEQAIGMQQDWLTEINACSKSVLYELMLEMVQDTTCAIGKLFDNIKTLDNISWKYFLHLLRLTSITVKNDKVQILRLRTIIREVFDQVVNERLFEKFVHLILIAREITAANEHVTGEYSSWYKSTLGEMSYRLSKENFILVMEMMTKLITLEKSVEYLKIHIKISISSPPKCMEMVVTYKQLCRAQLMKLKNEARNPTANQEFIVIVDNE